MPRFKVYVAGASSHLTIEHAAETAEDLFTLAERAGFVTAVAIERNGRRRGVLVPARNMTLIAESDDREPRVRQVRPASRTLS